MFRLLALLSTLYFSIGLVSAAPQNFGGEGIYCPAGHYLIGWKFTGKNELEFDSAYWSTYTADMPLEEPDPVSATVPFANRYPDGSPLEPGVTACGGTKTTVTWSNPSTAGGYAFAASVGWKTDSNPNLCHEPGSYYRSVFFGAVCAPIQQPEPDASGGDYCPSTVGGQLLGFRHAGQNSMAQEISDYWAQYSSSAPLAVANPGEIQQQFNQKYPYGYPLDGGHRSCGTTDIRPSWIGYGLYTYGIGLSYRVDNNGICNGPNDYYRAVFFRSVCGTEKKFPGRLLQSPSCSTCDVETVGNPIAPGDGNKIEVETDYDNGGMLNFVRTYQSRNGFSNSLSPGWAHNFEKRLVFIADKPGYDYQHPLTPLYDTDQQACEQGWLVLRGRYAGMLTTTATYDTGTSTCKIYRDSSQVNTLTIHGTAVQTSPTVLVSAERGNGRRIEFTPAGGGFQSAAEDKAQLSAMDGGYELKIGNLVERYDAAGQLLTVVGLGADRLMLSYTQYGKVYKAVDQHGRQLLFNYDSNQHLTSVTNPAGGVFSYGYDGNGRLLSSTGPDGKTRTYHYEKAGQPNALTGITDENADRFATFDYDAEGRAVKTQHQGNVGTFELTYNNDGTTTVEGPLGAQAVYSFSNINGKAKLSTQSQPCGVGCSDRAAAITYDVNGFVSSRTDFDGNLIAYTHNARGLETSRTEYMGSSAQRVVNTSWHADFPLPTQISSPGHTTEFTYDDDGNLLARTETDVATTNSRTTTYTYDGNKRLIEVDGPRTDVSDITAYAYNAVGDLVSVTNALAQVTQITSRNAHGDPLTIIDPNGLVITLTYDARRRLASRSVAGLSTSYEYDSVGQLVKTTLPDGHYLEYAYDGAHRLNGISDSLGNHIHYTLDAAGNRTQEDVYDPANALSRTRSQVFNNLSRLVQSIGGDDQVTAYAYDGNGNLLSVTDPLNHQTEYSYDAFNRLIQVTNPGSTTSHFSYDVRDQIVSVTDPKSLVTQYTRNAFGEPVALSSPDSGNSSATYDAAGNVLTRTDAKGQTTSYAYDALNRLTLITYDDNSTVSYVYDQGTYGKGHLTTVSDASGSISWVYDLLGRVTQKTESQGVISLVTQYTYDSNGHLVSQTLPSGKVVGFTWVNGQIDAVTLNSNVLLANISRQPFGPLAGWSFANTQSVVRSYDLDGRMTAHSLGALSYDDDGRVSGLTLGSLSVLSGSRTYNYDALNRLTTYSSATSLGYSYDANGNRLSESDAAGTTTTALVSGSNRISSVSSGSTTHSYTHDANGSVTQDGSNSYSYNAAGQLSTVNGYHYTYNGLSQRRAKIHSAVGTTLFSYDEQGQLLGEYDGAGSPVQETVWLGNTPVAVLKGSNAFFIHADHLNTPRQIDDASGTAVWAWNTLTFGASPPNEDPSSTSTTFRYNPRFAGQYYDSESGLHYNWHRYYDPNSGRYLQSDPIGLAGGINTYAYVGGNPISWVDPSGLAGETAVIPALIPGVAASLPAWVTNPVGAAVSGLLYPSPIYAPECELAGVCGPVMNKDGSESKPDNCPAGTLPIDKAKGKFDLDKDAVHGIKDGVGAGPKTWTGIDPKGNVWTGGPGGVGENHGHFGDYLPGGN